MPTVSANPVSRRFCFIPPLPPGRQGPLLSPPGLQVTGPAQSPGLGSHPKPVSASIGWPQESSCCHPAGSWALSGWPWVDTRTECSSLRRPLLVATTSSPPTQHLSAARSPSENSGHISQPSVASLCRCTPTQLLGPVALSLSFSSALYPCRPRLQGLSAFGPGHLLLGHPFRSLQAFHLKQGIHWQLHAAVGPGCGGQATTSTHLPGWPCATTLHPAC